VQPGQAQRVIVVSLVKSGTHLLQELMIALGYRMYGAGVRVSPGAHPVLDNETRWRIADMVFDKPTINELETGEEEDQFIEATNRAWEALGWSWHIRLAQPLATWYSRELIDTGFVEQVHRKAVGTDFSQTPAGVCWMINQLDITRVDGHFLREWAESGQPKIIFNYRDPRDVALSLVNFLCERTGRGYSDYNNMPAFSEILKSKATLEEQVAYALTDPSFPGHGDLYRMLWLLHHPDVCKTSFEELVGSRGGGSAEAQASVLARVFEFLGVTDRTPADVADRLFNPGSFTFYRGQIGAWKKAFTPRLRRLTEDRLGDLLRLYGYARES
jgi:hypothetical protein